MQNSHTKFMSSPLLIGCDMSKLTSTTLALLKNTELIELNQDSLCIQAYVAKHEGDTYVLVKDLYQLYGTMRAVIRLYTKTSAWMPNVDCMTLRKVDSTDRIVVGIGEKSPVVKTQDANSSDVYSLSGIRFHGAFDNISIIGNKKILAK